MKIALVGCGKQKLDRKFPTEVPLRGIGSQIKRLKEIAS
jgi:hypothetical protein